MSEAPKFKTFRDLKSIPKAGNASTSISSTSRVSSLPSIASTTRLPSTTSIAKQKKIQTDISPVRDFQKVPNSIPRNLDLFRGKSKQVWDYVWSISRGAINPSRTVRKSRKEIKEGSKLGSMVTVDAAIEHLVKIGLLKVVPNIGSIGGNEYEIFTPEEIDLSNTSSTSISSNTSLTQTVDELDIPESGNTSTTQTQVNKTTYSEPNTLLKTNTNDDEAFALLIENFQVAAVELTGKKLTKRDAEKLEELSELLVLELKVAAKRTDGVTSVPAFLTEVLRRQFFASRQQQQSSPAKSSKTKPDTIGKSDKGTYEIKLLDEQGREAALDQLREFAGDVLLEDFRKWYTPEDWAWLTEKLEKK